MNQIAKDILMQEADEQRSRLERWRRVTLAYQGNGPKALKVKPGKPDDNVKIGKVDTFVQKSVNFLFGKGVTFEIDEDRTTEEEEYLDKVWKRNRKITFLKNVAVNGALYGHVFIRVLPPDPNDPKQLPRFLNIDPMNVNVRWSPNDIEDVLWIHVSYPAVDRNNRPVVQRQRYESVKQGGYTVGWEIIEEQSSPDSDKWVEVNRLHWPYAFCPIVHTQNLSAPNEFWGKADVEENLVDLIDAQNFILSNLRKIFRYHGNPKPLASGIQQQHLKMDTDELSILPNPEAKFWFLEMSGGNIPSQMEFYETLKAAIHEEAHIPEVALGNLQSVGSVSGIALELLFQPLREITEAKHETYGELLELLNSIVLVMGGYRDHIDDIEVKTIWPELLPKDMMEIRQANQSDLDQGILSRTTAAGRLGLNLEAEMKKKEEEDKKYPQQPPQQPPPQQQQQPPDGQKSVTGGENDIQTVGGNETQQEVTGQQGKEAIEQNEGM